MKTGESTTTGWRWLVAAIVLAVFVGAVVPVEWRLIAGGATAGIIAGFWFARDDLDAGSVLMAIMLGSGVGAAIAWAVSLWLGLI